MVDLTKYRALASTPGDQTNPVIEKGKWTFDNKIMIITLNNKKMHSNYHFYTVSLKLTFKVKEITNKTMKISFIDNPNCKKDQLFTLAMDACKKIITDQQERHGKSN